MDSITLGKNFPFPLDLYKYQSMEQRNTPEFITSSLFLYFIILLATRYQHLTLPFPREE